MAQSGSYREFARLWFKTAFTAAWTWTAAAACVVGLCALYLVKRYPAWESRLIDLGWQIPLAMFGIIFISRTFIAPFKIFADQREQISELATNLNRKRENQALADELTKKYRYGVNEILNRAPNSQSELPEWRERASEWLADVLSLMHREQCTLQEINHVETLGLFAQIRLSADPAIAKALSEFVARLQRVADISTSYVEHSRN